VKQLNHQFTALWQDYGAFLLLGAGTAGVLALLALLIWARRTSRPLRPIALALSMNLALLLNAEGMWVIATGDLRLPPVFAALVFAVFEISFLTATSLAAEQYRRSTVYGPDGTVVSPGHPGPMLYIAALIALVSGVIVASNAHTGTEKLLRLTVPAVIFLMWWAALTAPGQKTRRGRFAYSPRRLAERWGWLIPDDDPDLVRMAAERQARRMVINYYRVAAKRWPHWWWRSRLFKDARTAGDRVVADVVQQLGRVTAFMNLLPADRRTGLLLGAPIGARLPDLSGLLRQSGQVPAAAGSGTGPADMFASPVDPSEQTDTDLSADSPAAAANRSTVTAGGQVRAGKPTSRPADADRRRSGPAAADTRADTAAGSTRVSSPRRPSPAETLPAEVAAPAVEDSRWRQAVAQLSGHERAPHVQWEHLLSAPAPGGEPRTDEQLLDLFGEELDQVLRSKGELTRYRVEQITSARRRQADRIKAVIESRARTTVTADRH
jgi:hypothetical protein